MLISFLQLSTIKSEYSTYRLFAPYVFRTIVSKYIIFIFSVTEFKNSL